MQKDKSKFARFIFNQRTLALLGFVILILISIPLGKNISQRRGLNKEIAGMEEEIKKIEGKNSDLRQMVDYLSSKQYLEEQARLNFNLKKSGEEVAVIKRNDNVLTATATDLIYDLKIGEGQKIKNTNPVNWYAFFFKIKK